MGRILISTFAVLVIAAFSGVAAESSLVLAGRQTTSHETAVSPTTTTTAPKPVVPVAPSPEPVSTPAPISTPAPVIAAPSTTTATITGYVHMRADRSTASAVLVDLYSGYIVSYTTVDSGLWQAVSYNGISGYVFKDYLTY